MDLNVIRLYINNMYYISSYYNTESTIKNDAIMSFFISYDDFKKLDFGHIKPMLIEINFDTNSIFGTSFNVYATTSLDPEVNTQKYKRYFGGITSNFSNPSNIKISSIPQTILKANNNKLGMRFGYHFKKDDWRILEKQELKLSNAFQLTAESNVISATDFFELKIEFETLISYNKFEEMMRDWHYWNYLLERWEQMINAILEIQTD